MGGGFLSRGSALGAQKIYCVFSAQCSYFTIIYGDHSFHGQNYQMYAGCMGLVFQIGSKPGKMEPQHSIWLDLLQRWSNFELPTTQNRNYEENMGRGGPRTPTLGVTNGVLVAKVRLSGSQMGGPHAMHVHWCAKSFPNRSKTIRGSKVSYPPYQFDQNSTYLPLITLGTHFETLRVSLFQLERRLSPPGGGFWDLLHPHFSSLFLFWVVGSSKLDHLWSKSNQIECRGSILLGFDPIWNTKTIQRAYIWQFWPCKQEYRPLMVEEGYYSVKFTEILLCELVYLWYEFDVLYCSKCHQICLNPTSVAGPGPAGAILIGLES